MQYPHHPKHCDQALRETPECVNPAEYVKYLPNRAYLWGSVGGDTPGRVDRAGLRRLGFRVPTPHHGSPRTSARSGVLPFLGL